MADNTALTTKQKVIAAVTVIIFGFIIYEVIGLFSSDKSAEPAIQPAKSGAPAQTKPASGTGTESGSPRQMPQQMMLPTVSVLTPARETVEAQKAQQQQQQAYLDSVNQLQLLKVKKDIAETNQAIATARLATETANKSMSDLLTRPAMLPEAPEGNYAGKVQDSTTVQPPARSEAASLVKPQAVADVPFTVVSVSMQSNRWNAVLGYQDKLYSVLIGDSLFDGSTVSSISKSGVTLMKDGKKRRISIQTTI